LPSGAGVRPASPPTATGAPAYTRAARGRRRAARAACLREGARATAFEQLAVLERRNDRWWSENREPLFRC